MTTQPGTLETLAQELALALQPLEQRLAAGQAQGFLAELGLGLPASLAGEAQFAAAIASTVTSVAGLAPLIAQLVGAVAADNEAQIVAVGIQLLDQIAHALSGFAQMGTALDNAVASAAGMTAAQKAELQSMAQELAVRLLNYAVVEYLRSKASGVVPTLNLIGIVDDMVVPGTGTDPVAPPYQERALHLDRLFDLFLNPAKYLKETFGWGDASFDGMSLFPRVKSFLDDVKIPVTIITAPGQPPILEAFIFRLSTDASTSPPSLTGRLRIPATQDFNQTYPLGDLWAFTLDVGARFDGGLELTLKPPFDITFAPPSGTVSITASGGLAAQHADKSPIILLGQTGGSRIEAVSLGVSVGLEASASVSGTTNADPTASAEIKGGKVVIDTSDADGFIASVTSGIHVEADVDIKMTWAPDTGVHFDGGAQFTLTLPLHLDLGPISIPTLYLSAGFDSSGIPLEVSVALGVTLGPFQASVDRIGMKGLLSFPDHGGNLGSANLAIGFKPPNGLGISVDAGVVAGGGYISFDPDKGQYAGVLELSLVDIVQVKVIGILDTKMPDGSSGYSFLLIITFDLPPIQLGFGFTLNGVGGIAGVNRTMSIDALRAGLRAHTLDSVMFPPDPIKNAPQIISNVRSFFPPAEGRYLFGPMVELGWGTPTLITLSVGVILEVPDPVRLAILGLIHAGLPTADIALIDLHIDVLGTYDGGTKSLAIDGSLYDSHVLIYSVAGDLALRLNMGSDPNFMFSLGGFNPHFNTAGLDIPAMQRLSVSIGDGDNPRISSNSYFAVTSNSLQFGANTELYAEAGGFSVHGYLGFDVIIIYSPFSFEFDFNAGFDVSFEGTSLCGISVDGMLSGPHPWHVRGHAELHILFFSVGKTIDLTWGDSTPAVLPQKPVLDDLVPALENPGNWSTALPDGTSQGVSLLPSKPDGTTLRVHPMGTLSVREKIVPLDQTITRYGNATPSDGTNFAIGGVTINGQGETQQTFQDYFAAGQFFTLSDADKLSRPSFEKYDAGIQIGSDAVLSGADSPRNVVYEERYVDEPDGFSRLARIYSMPADIHLSLVALGAGFASPLKNTGLAKYRNGPAAAAVVSQDPGYVIAGVEDLAIRHDIASAQGTTYFAARAALQSHLAVHPEDSANLQILPVHEAAA